MHCPEFFNLMKACHKHAITLFTQRGNTYIQEQTDSNSQPHLYANSVKKSLAMLSQTWVKICFLTAVFSEYDVPQGFTWRCGFAFLFMIDAAAHSSEPCVSNEGTRLTTKSPTLAKIFFIFKICLWLLVWQFSWIKEKATLKFAHHFPGVENNDDFGFTPWPLPCNGFLSLVHTTLHRSDFHNFFRHQSQWVQARWTESGCCSKRCCAVPGFSIGSVQRNVLLFRGDRVTCTNRER